MAQTGALGRRTKKTREQIYTAAMELFEARGVEDVTMKDIAERADTARSTVFNHFPNKVNLLEEFYRRFIESILSQTKETETTSIIETMEVFFKFIYEHSNKNKVIVSQIANLSLGIGPLAKMDAEVDEKVFEFLYGVVSECLLHGVNNTKRILYVWGCTLFDPCSWLSCSSHHIC